MITMDEPRLDLRVVRRCALAAVLLDTAAIVLLLAAVAAHEELVIAVGAPLIAAGILAVRVPRLGLLLTPFRAFEFIVVLIGGLVDPWLFGASALAFIAVVTGLVGALRPAFPLDASAVLFCSRCRQPVANPMMIGRGRRPLCSSCAKRRDEVGSAALLLGAFLVLVALTGANEGPVAAVRLAVAAAGLVLVPVAIHEAGHAIAARSLGNKVTEVVVGSGLQLIRVGVVSVHAFPADGRTVFTPNEATMTSRREALIFAAGPAANFAAAGALMLISASTSDSLFMLLAVTQAGTGAMSLLPWSIGSHSPHSDGARLRALLHTRAQSRP
jgi:hypothetical protein